MLIELIEQEESVAKAAFTSEELEAFETWFGAETAWHDWHRGVGAHGEDVIEITPQGNRGHTLRLAKGENGYLATGFDGWGLTVCDDFDELLVILSHWRPTPGAAAIKAA